MYSFELYIFGKDWLICSPCRAVDERLSQCLFQFIRACALFTCASAADILSYSAQEAGTCCCHIVRTESSVSNMVLYLLSEAASGYALFEVKEADVIGSEVESMQSAMAEYSRFSKMMKLTAFAPFRSAEHALENANMVSEGAVSEFLAEFLEINLPMGKIGRTQTKLGIHRDPKFKSSVSEALSNGISVSADDHIEDLLRGVRMHFDQFISGLSSADAVKAQLGLAHSYSRSKVKFNVHKSDNMIIQSIALLDQLDKDINTFAMRIREWYSWHFPELIKVVTDNIQYARVVGVVKNKSSLTEDSIPALVEVLVDEDIARDVLAAACSSMGTDISDVDLININMFAARVVQLAQYRAGLHKYLMSKMSAVAPNLAALIGDQVGARLISHAGSLTSLAKYPASTVQILGAEKALFRALKTKGKTPKYGLLYHSTFIGRAKTKNKGRISRYLANKCSIASRMDCFSEIATDVFGRKLREQVEERLKFYETGTAPRKNLDVMKEAVEEAAADALENGDENTVALKSKKEAKLVKTEEADISSSDKKAKKKAKKESALVDVESSGKKDKKRKKEGSEGTEKKKKKKKKSV